MMPEKPPKKPPIIGFKSKSIFSLNVFFYYIFKFFTKKYFVYCDVGRKLQVECNFGMQKTLLHKTLIVYLFYEFNFKYATTSKVS